MAFDRCPTIARLDPLHDPHTRASHSAISSSHHIVNHHKTSILYSFALHIAHSNALPYSIPFCHFVDSGNPQNMFFFISQPNNYTWNSHFSTIHFPILIFRIQKFIALSAFIIIYPPHYVLSSPLSLQLYMYIFLEHKNPNKTSFLPSSIPIHLQNHPTRSIVNISREKNPSMNYTKKKQKHIKYINVCTN